MEKVGLTESYKKGYKGGRWIIVETLGKSNHSGGKLTMFIGEYLYLIDQKKRLSVPSKFRKDLGRRVVVTKGIEKCLVIYPLKEWAKLAKKLESLPTSQTDARGFVRIMLSGAVDVGLDKLGRILIPDYLKEYALLKKNVAILGLSNRIEIWDKNKWQSFREKTETAVGDIAERLTELGI